jgi:hypothetical protein
MFAGNFGYVLRDACVKFGIASPGLASVSFSQLHFFGQLRLCGSAPDKFYSTYLADLRSAQVHVCVCVCVRTRQSPKSIPTCPHANSSILQRTIRNIKSMNRCGSNAIVSGLDPHTAEAVVRIQVNMRPVAVWSLWCDLNMYLCYVCG